MKWNLFFTCIFAACTSDRTKDTENLEPSVEVTDSAVEGELKVIHVQVRDEQGTEIPNVLLTQPGTGRSMYTDSQGFARFPLIRDVEGEFAIVASTEDHLMSGDSWRRWERIPAEETVVEVVLRGIPEDHDTYQFQDPGSPTRNETTAQCAHCHYSITEDWYASPHRTSASNPWLHAVYEGRTEVGTEASCLNLGHQWLDDACYSSNSVLQGLNDCSDALACQEEATQFGACADCHAPGINGVQGGRDLLEAEGFALDDGVHCDVCHKIYDVDPSHTLPGVAGKIEMRRPDDDGSNPLDLSLEVQYGPLPDVLNPRMGSARRDIFRSADFCAGCHQYNQPIWAEPSAASTRWSTTGLPVHSTYSELKASGLTDVHCQSCHMSPNNYPQNSADLGSEITTETPNIAFGWVRGSGEVRHHRWDGPRSNLDFLQSAALLQTTTTQDGTTLRVHVTTRNVGAGHAIPTGEPSRAIYLKVEALCDAVQMKAIGGAVIPSFGGFAAQKTVGMDWTVWESAEVGDVIRVVRRDQTFVDYNGVAPFTSEMDIVERGYLQEFWVGEVQIQSIQDGVVTTNEPIPVGDIAYLIRGTAQLAGQSGFAFARVLKSASGELQVPHYRAVDIAWDNRLMPHQAWTSTHEFETSCTNPTVHATLIWRRMPYALSMERGVDVEEQIMAEVWQ